jgi:O-antigen/teichoic acid export membrane protein
MGVIKRQSIKNSLVTYLGVMIGAISVIWIYPLIDEEDFGMLQFAMNTALLFAPLAAVASQLTAIHYFPLFKNARGRADGFIFLLTSLTLASTLIFCLLIYLFRDGVALFFDHNAPHFKALLPFILVFTVFIALGNLFHSFINNHNRIVIPVIFGNLLIKIAQPVFVLLFFYGLIQFPEVFKGMALALCLMVLGLVGYLAYLGQLDWRPDWSKFNRPLLKQMYAYSSFNLLVTLGAILSQRVDQVIIGGLLGFSSAAIFSVPFFISEAIDVPRKALSAIAAPLISDSIKAERFGHVEEIYKKTALLQLIVGTYLLVGVWACADALYSLMPNNAEDYRLGKNLILILGLSRLVDMATGTNMEILTYSKYYRFNFRSLMTMAVLNVVLNIILIKYAGWGIQGSAWATLISITVVNFWRLIYLKQKIGIQPLQTKMISILLIGIGVWMVAFLTPSVSQPIFDIFLKGLIITLLYGSIILYFRFSDDLNQLLDNLIKPLSRKP